jgi:hypothetical protein
MPAVWLTERGRCLGQAVGVIFDGPIVSKSQRVEPLTHLGFQFNTVPVAHIREHITSEPAACTEPSTIAVE